ncbi:MAG: hypothetical protein AAF664_09755 [Planctomycetota bacterium]
MLKLQMDRPESRSREKVADPLTWSNLGEERDKTARNRYERFAGITAKPYSYFKRISHHFALRSVPANKDALGLVRK